MKPEGKQEGLSEWLGPRDATPAGELEFFFSGETQRSGRARRRGTEQLFDAYLQQ